MSEIKPALSAEEWARGEAYRECGRTHVTVTDEGFVGATGLYDDDTSGAHHALIALANAALPDGDPRKLTWDDVDACKAFDFEFGGMSSDSVEVSREDCERLQCLADRIAALLPPR